MILNCADKRAAKERIMALDDSNPYKKALRYILDEIAEQIDLPEGSRNFVIYLLDSEEKILDFNKWYKRKLKHGKFCATAQEVVRAAVQAGHGTLFNKNSR